LNLIETHSAEIQSALIFNLVLGNYYWKLSPDGFVNSYPLLISHRWPGLPGDIDTALATSSGRTYFFKGSKYWAYEYTHPLPGHPKLISKGWPGIPDDLDAATWYTNSVFYFFKGESALMQ
jgi:matrix metalloproteinase-14 (membrane-inserted)